MAEVKNFGLAGVGNVPFSDVERALQSKAGAITKILVGHGDVVDSIQTFNGNISMLKHGGNGGTTRFASSEFKFMADVNNPVMAFYGSSYIYTDGTNFISSIGIASINI